jgi:phosphatidylserine/phosphatidylglycerophosphate/cardiolipin synthase-like enzyme
MNVRRVTLCFALCAFLGAPSAAADRFCDPSFENCRTPLLELIRKETVGIDVGFWFMEDTRYATELIRRWQAGVPVRVVMDSRAVTQYGYTAAAVPLQMMKDAGIPMRSKATGGILHFKTMIFAGQHVVQFSAANYSSEAFVPIQPYVNYVDEIIYFSDNPATVNSFMTRFDDVWTDTASFAGYANVPGALVRRYPQYPIAPELNFVPWQNFRSRSIARYRAETQRIDAIMYRITDRAHSDELIAAVRRGVPVRLISEPHEYRSTARLWHSWNVDRLYAAGVQIRHRKHAGLLHEKLTILNGSGFTIFGSSNWTSASASSQHEHNLFTGDPGFFTWARDHFDRKWTNRTGHAETEPFLPLPPHTPSLVAPADGAGNQPATVTLSWYAGPWAHKYDVYLGTSPTSLTRVLADGELGPSVRSTDYVTWTLTGLAGGTTYYWQIVSRTMANLERTSVVRSFTTGAGGAGGGTTGGRVTSVAATRSSATGAFTFTANVTGGTALQYKWWLFDGRTWSILRDWGSSGTASWTPARAGTYRVGVWVRNAGTTVDAPQSNAGVNVTVGAAATAALQMRSVTASGTSPHLAGTPITFTANATGGTAPRQFKWWLFDGTAWRILRNWSSSGSLAWTPPRAGAYRVGAWVRSAGVTADAPQANAGINVTAITPFRMLGVTPTGTDPHPAGTAITFTAAAAGGSGRPEFKWWLFNGSSWVVLRNWSTSASVVWTPPLAGAYRVGAWVRNAGVSRDAPESNAGVNVVVNGP